MTAYTVKGSGFTLNASDVVVLDAAGKQVFPVVVPPPVTGPQPPAPVTNVSAGATLAAIQDLINKVPAGGSLVFPAGMTIPGAITGKAGITLWADGIVAAKGSFNFTSMSGWTVRGKAPGAGFVFNGTRINADNASKFAVGYCTFNGIAANGYDGSGIAMNGATFATVINNDFNACLGNVVGMYNLDTANIDGNHFTDCGQPISLQFPTITDKTKGNKISIVRNVFIGTQRACIEVGPADAPGAEYTADLIVNNNFFDAFKNNTGASAMLPISLVAEAAVRTTCQDNFIRAGSPASDGKDTVAIEMSGSGDCSGNTVWGFSYVVIAYNAGGNVHDNSCYQDKFGYLNYDKGATLGKLTELTAPPVVPAWPARIAW